MKITGLVSAGAAKVPGVTGTGCFEEDLQKTQKKFHAEKFTAKKDEAFLIPSAAGSAVLLLGLGKKEKFTLEAARRAAARTVCEAKRLRLDRARLELEGFGGKFPAEGLVSAAVEGARLSDYRFGKYKSKPSPVRRVSTFEIVAGSGNPAKIKDAIRKSEIICEGVALARDLANEPANVMTPAALARAAKKMAAGHGLKCRVLGRTQMQRLGMGGILGVSQGSANPPQFVILEHRLTAASRPIVLVGKGITFDTGGISIKPSNDMDKMKFDMCGAAAVIGAMRAIAALKLPFPVVGLTPICENMPGGAAQRPGDIVRCMNGKTVEVLNTDAEGRLILADALAYAGRYKPRAVVDIATLTGACAATFADLATGVMGTDEDLVRRIERAGEYTGERCWELPLWEEYADLIRATYADIQNISKKYAGTITAGMFLKEFADHTKSWAHLDIAGTAWNESGPKPLSPIGATGVGVRLFVELVKSYAES
ncbi:MAG: leucyl aminopeptidase [Candidatus Omnitrophica bacterium]|nr:leucyl aminopeptidase [Candidatus Omnitrophota bacterium]